MMDVIELSKQYNLQNRDRIKEEAKKRREWKKVLGSFVFLIEEYKITQDTTIKKEIFEGIKHVMNNLNDWGRDILNATYSLNYESDPEVEWKFNHCCNMFSVIKYFIELRNSHEVSEYPTFFHPSDRQEWLKIQKKRGKSDQ